MPDTGAIDALPLDYLDDAVERHAIERYEARLCRALVDNLPRFATAITALDFAAGEGLAAFALLRRLAPGSRLVAVADENQRLERLHDLASRALAPADHGTRFFARREDLLHLPFATDRFDLAYAVLPTGALPEPRAVLAQVLRVLRPRGVVALVTALPGSLVELTQAIAHTELARNDEHAKAVVAGRLAGRAQLLSPTDWLALLTRAGATELTTLELRLSLTVSADPDPLYTNRLVALYLGSSREDAETAPQLLRAAIPAPLTTTVSVAVILGRKATAPAAPPPKALPADRAPGRA